jgi:DoxX-like family
MNRQIQIVLIYLIATIWLINGLFCKLLNLVPRHQQIVARFFGNEYAPLLTKIIGISEIFMAIWILSRIKTKLNAVTQIIIIAVMNMLEFLFAPDLLLWGRLNLLFAFILILVIYYNEFVLNKKTGIQT